MEVVVGPSALVWTCHKSGHKPLQSNRGHKPLTRSPSSGLLSFLGEGSPTKIDYKKKSYPYSNLSTGGPS